MELDILEVFVRIDYVIRLCETFSFLRQTVEKLIKTISPYFKAVSLQ